MKNFDAAASNKLAEVAAEEALADRGTAADAIAAGFFALAGGRPEALCAPFVAMVAGPSAVGRVFDGRTAQPGKNGTRVRGLRPEEVPSLAARAAVPRSLGAVLLLIASFGNRSLSRTIQAGVRVAKDNGEDARKRTLERVLSHGAAALITMREPILASVGKVAGGSLTEEDFELEPGQAEALGVSGTTVDGTRFLAAREPFATEDGSSGLSSEVETIVAVDSRGMVAAGALFVGHASFDERMLLLEGLGIAWPLSAPPPRRGETRRPPGAIFGVPSTLLTVDGGPAARVALAYSGKSFPSSVGDLLESSNLAEGLRVLGRDSAASVIATEAGASRLRGTEAVQAGLATGEQDG